MPRGSRPRPTGRSGASAGGATPSLGTIDLAPGVGDVAVGRRRRLDREPTCRHADPGRPDTVDRERTIELDGIPLSVAVDGGTVWVAASRGQGRTVTKEVAGVEPLPSRTCEPVLAGLRRGGSARRLRPPASGRYHDHDRRRWLRRSRSSLRERDFRAGRFSIAYQSCDDSIATTGLYDEAKCEANARAYAQNPEVIGVIGTLNSPCALAALPALNRAADGPLAMVSPANSFVGADPCGARYPPVPAGGSLPDGAAQLRARVSDGRPPGRRACLARTRPRGTSECSFSTTGTPATGRSWPTGFATASRRLGSRWPVVRAGTLGAETIRRSPQRVARSGATAVFIGGLLDTNAARVVRDLRSRLGTLGRSHGARRPHSRSVVRRSGGDARLLA